VLNSHALTAEKCRLSDAGTAEKLQLNTNALNAAIQDLTKMADVVITLKVMPDSPEIDLKAVQDKVGHLVKEFGGEVGKIEEEPVGFGLVALKFYFVMSEDLGSTDDLEEKISQMKEVGNVEVTDVRRAIG
jgi:elongation factor 1-beta